MTEAAPHPDPEAPARLKLTSPADVVAAVPYLVGFQPENSLVLLSLRGSRHRVGLTMRADLPWLAEVPDATSQLVRHVLRDGAEAVIAVFYADQFEAAEWWPRLQEALSQDGVAIREALRVTDGRWWSYLCSVPAYCPAAGTLILQPHEAGGPARVGAELVTAGLVALGSRQELADSVASPHPAGLAPVEAALELAARQIVRRLVRPGGLAACRREWQQHVRRVLPLWSRPSPPPTLPDPDLVELLIALGDTPTRDLAADWSTGRGAAVTESVQALWRELTRRAPPPYDVAPATLLAHSAWYAGNGALARIAIERALASDPSYRLAQLIERLLDEGIDPATARRQRQRALGRGRR